MATTITPVTTFAEMVTTWLESLRAERLLESTAINQYERVLRGLVVPALGEAALARLTTAKTSAVLTGLGNESVHRQRKAKVVTGASLDVAVERGALASNPVQDSMGVSRPKTAAPPLTDTDLESAQSAVPAWMAVGRPGPKASWDTANPIELMIPTGARIGEVLALRWVDVDLDARRVYICATIKTETCRGTYRKPLPVPRVVTPPGFAVHVLRQPRTQATDNPIDAVFSTRNGNWQQVNNVERRWRQIRKDADLDWVTPEAFRQSVKRKP